MPDSPTFICQQCSGAFTVASTILARYPGWTPATCLACRGRGRPAPPRRAPSAGPTGTPDGAEEPLPAALERRLETILARHTDGPHHGVFTDGGCSGNPGPGGWAAVWVEEDRPVARRFGHARRTTNNRMELTALIEGYRLLPEDSRQTVWSDSNLVVRTINEWAEGWRRRGWRRRTGAVENLDLVQEAYRLARLHPHVELRWIKAHRGARWNEYADALANAWQHAGG